MSLDVSSILADLKQSLADSVVELRRNPGPASQDSLLIASKDLVVVMQQLRDAHGFDLLSNVTGVDWFDGALADKIAVVDVVRGESESADDQKEEEVIGFIEVVYHLYAIEKRIGPLVLRCRTQNRSDQVSVPSIVSVFRSAEFQEREIYDLFGVIFTDHPDLRRILMWDEFEDHPMRKDYEAPDDYEYEPTPHDAVLEKAKGHHSSES